MTVSTGEDREDRHRLTAFEGLAGKRFDGSLNARAARSAA